MKFGSAEMMELMKQHLEDAEDIAWYDELFKSVYEHTGKRLRRRAWHLTFPEREDMEQVVITKVFLKVIREKVDFYLKNQNTSEVQRISWLNMVIDNTVNDLIRTKGRDVPLVAASGDDIYSGSGGDGDDKQISQKDLEDYKELSERTNPHNPEARTINKIRITEAVKDIFSINTTAEYKLVAISNMISATTGGRNGSPKEIVEDYTGKTIGDIYEIVKKQLALLLGYSLPLEALRIMDECVKLESDNLFSMDERKIADKTNWISKKMREIKEKKGESYAV